MIVASNGSKDEDPFAPLLGVDVELALERFELSESRRYLAVQTTDARLASDQNPDTNDRSDIYLLDRELSTVRRVTLLAGAETFESAYLLDLRESSNQVEIAFASAAPFVSSSIDGNSSAINSELQKTDLYQYSAGIAEGGISENATFDLVSVTSDGIASGLIEKDQAVAMTDLGVYFSSTSPELDEADQNASADAFRFAEGANQIIAAGASTSSLETGSVFASATIDGQRVLTLSSSAEISPAGIQQAVLYEIDTGKWEVISSSIAGVASDGWVISGLISNRGGRIAFTTDATNLMTSDPVTASGDLYLKVEY